MVFREQLLPAYHSGGEPSPIQKFLEAVKEAERKDRVRFKHDLGGDFMVALKTRKFRPAHTVTLRNSRDGWAADVRGQYWQGRWLFRLDPDKYPARLKSKFFVDGREMRSEAITLRPEPDVTVLYDESSFVFPEVPVLYSHGYDNLQVTSSKMQQELVPGNRDESRFYDVIVIGSGIGGGVLADELSDADVNTLLLEVGSLDFQTHIDNLPGHTFNFGASQEHEVGHYINRPGSSSNMANSVQMNLGGRSVYWEGLIPRMDDWELPHWPTSIQDYLTVDSGYEKAEKLVRRQRTLGPFQDGLISDLAALLTNYDVSYLPRALHQPNLDATASQLTNVLERSTGVFSTADLLLDSLTTDPYVGREFLTVNLNHLVTKIKTKYGKATKVICRDLIGNVKRKYKAKFVVLAAGSLESSRIALASGFTDSTGKIGIGLTDHPAFVHEWPVELKSSSPYADATNHAKILIRHQNGAAHPYSAELVVNPRYWDARHSDDEVMELATGSTDKSFATMKFLFDSELNDNNEIKYKGSGQKLEVFVEANNSALGFKGEVTALRDVVFSFLQADYDPAQEMNYYANGSVHHAGGSLRMSSDHSGVVDENLKFEDYDNIYCCDVSVFPRIPTANPGLTLVALAQRLAGHLKSKL